MIKRITMKNLTSISTSSKWKKSITERREWNFKEWTMSGSERSKMMISLWKSKDRLRQISDLLIKIVIRLKEVLLLNKRSYNPEKSGRIKIRVTK
jgi:hypothetical protein